MAQGKLKKADTANNTGTGDTFVFGTSPTLATPVINGLPTGTGVASASTASTLMSRDTNGNASFNQNIGNTTLTATAGATTTLTVSSTYQQIFTGTSNQTVQMPVATTLTTGMEWYIDNNSTGTLTVNSSGGNTIVTIPSRYIATVTCINPSGGTGTASWDFDTISTNVDYIIRADATRTFTSNTTQQAIFTTPANGALTLGTGTYMFEALIAMDTMSATSGNGKFSLIGAGTATLAAILWQAYGNDLAAEATGAATGGTWHIIATQTATNISTAATGTAICFQLKGTFEVSATGTIIPSFAQTTASAAVVNIGSYFKCTRVGSTSMTSIGPWS